MTELQDKMKAEKQYFLETGRSTVARRELQRKFSGWSECGDLMKGRVFECLSNGSQYWY